MTRNIIHTLALMVVCLTIGLHLRSQHGFESRLNAIVDAREARSLGDLPEGMNRVRKDFGLPAITPKNDYEFLNADLEGFIQLQMVIHNATDQ